MKIQSILICFAMMTTFALSSAQNLVKNPGFEEGTAEWKYAAECGEVVAGAGRDGSAGFIYRRTDPADYHILRQDVELEPGRRYRFSAWARPADAETPVGNIGIILEFSKDGVFLGTQYMDNEPEDGSDWRHYHSEFTAGAEGTSYSLGVYMPQGDLGSFVTDDIAITPVASEWRFGQILPWGNLGQPGDELSFASIYNDIPLDRQSVTLRFLDGDGDEVAKSTHAPGKDGTLRFVLPAWHPGDYRVLATLTDDGGTVRGAAELPLKVVAKRDRKVELSPNGSFIVEGKPFYAVGAYSNGHFDNTQHEEMAALGYNCSLPYPMVADWSKLENIDKYVEELDKCEKLGLKVIFCLVFHFRLSNDLKTFQKFVAPWLERVKDHPALLAYYLMDEPPFDKAQLAADCRRWLNQADPNHPVFAVFCNQMAINDFLNGVDCVGTDIYPFSNQVHSVKRQLINLGAIRGRGLPVWLVAQSYDMGNVIACPHYYPTGMEILAQGMAGYISDAGGLLYWCYYHININAPDPEKRLDEMKRAVAILKDVAPFALAPQAAEPPAWLAGAQADKTAWRYLEKDDGEARLLVLAANEPGTFRVELPEGMEFAGSATGLTTLQGRTLVFTGATACDCDAIALKHAPAP